MRWVRWLGSGEEVNEGGAICLPSHKTHLCYCSSLIKPADLLIWLFSTAVDIKKHILRVFFSSRRYHCNFKGRVEKSRKHVKNLKKKSLWSKILEEVTEKLVDIVHFLHLEIHAAFGCADGERSMKNNNQRLGSAGLALHYVNIIAQIDTLARDLILRLMEERDSILRQNAKLNRDLELLRHGCHERRTGVRLLYILLVSLADILLGFIVRNI